MLNKDELSIDSIMQGLANTVFQHGKATRTNTPFHDGEPIKEAKQALFQLLLEVIGEDDTRVRGTTQNPENPLYWTKRTKHRNELRQEYHTKLHQLFNIEE